MPNTCSVSKTISIDNSPGKPGLFDMLLAFFKTVVPPDHGILEIEEDFVQFFYPFEGNWQVDRIYLGGRDLFDILKGELSRKFSSLIKISVVLHINSGTKLLPFPKKMSEREILEHLFLKREEYFGNNYPMYFSFSAQNDLDENNHELLVSYANKLTVDRLRELITESGFSLDSIMTEIETMIGTFRENKSMDSAKNNCLLSIGYSGVNMVIIKDGKIIALRNSITGSIREIETRLMKTLRLKQEQVDDYLSGKVSNPDQQCIEIIQQNTRELLARITPFFAYIRAKDKTFSSPSIFLLMPYLKIAGIRENLEKTLNLPIKDISENPPVKSLIQADYSWVFGVNSEKTTNLIPKAPPFLRLHLSQKAAWMFIVFFLLVPLGFFRINSLLTSWKIEILKEKNEDLKPLIEQIKINDIQFQKFSDITSFLRQEISGQILHSKMLCDISTKVTGNLTLDSVTLNSELKNLTISAYAIDTESAISFWNSLKSINELKEVKISLAEINSGNSVPFSITAKVVK
ncbi:MAG: hypothetical protein HQM10_21100 [Candidatus Riflebacteria bacterium]|nr:hypothetical protein [Candidatus Riflebacteria bacterium]